MLLGIMETEVELHVAAEDKVEEDEIEKISEEENDKSEDVVWKEVVQTAVDAVVLLPNMVEKSFEETYKDGKKLLGQRTKRPFRVLVYTTRDCY